MEPDQGDSLCYCTMLISPLIAKAIPFSKFNEGNPLENLSLKHEYATPASPPGQAEGLDGDKGDGQSHAAAAWAAAALPPKASTAAPAKAFGCQGKLDYLLPISYPPFHSPKLAIPF